MEEVIKKSDEQLKDILDDLVDYKKHSSKKDPLIKELSKQKQHLKGNINNSTKITTNKPGASLNSSTYSSAASSSSLSTSSSASDSSTSSTTSSDSSSTSSSPSQSQNGSVALNVVLSSTNNTNNYKNKNIINNQQENGKLEMAKMEDLGKRGNFVEIRRLVETSDTEHLYNCTTDVNNKVGADFTFTGPASELTLTKIHKQNEPDILSSTLSNNNAANSNNTESTWKTKRDKRRKKPVEKEITARDIPGNIGDRTVEELEYFIKVSFILCASV